MVNDFVFHKKVIAVFGLPSNYPENGPQNIIARSNRKFIEKEYDKRFSLNGLFKEIYADKLQDLIAPGTRLINTKKKKK